MKASGYRIVVAEALSDEAMERLREAGDVRVIDACDAAALAAAVSDCHALVVPSNAHVTEAVVEAGKQLKVIGRAGVGLDGVDLEAARARAVSVVYTPAASTDSVAEHTVGLMLALERRMVHADAMVRQQRFLEARDMLIGRQLRGLTLGVVGMGRIGSAVARICHQGLGMDVLYNDIRDVGPLAFETRTVAKSELYRESDVVTLHVPLTSETRGLIDKEALRCFRSSATLINTSRGSVVSPDALADALRDGRLAGAALDVHQPEPPPADHPLLKAPNVLLSPHLGARTASSLAAMNDVVDDVIAVLHGREPSYPAW